MADTCVRVALVRVDSDESSAVTADLTINLSFQPAGALGNSISRDNSFLSRVVVQWPVNHVTPVTKLSSREAEGLCASRQSRTRRIICSTTTNSVKR
ncbi:hypothetical protein TNCV_617941 [Trichonephila clavipes]|nr:hypothetical protein TNCV_617941 [Trichonephila clavipes]